MTFEIFVMLLAAGVAAYYYYQYNEVIEHNIELAELVQDLIITNNELYNRLPEDRRDGIRVVTSQECPF